MKRPVIKIQTLSVYISTTLVLLLLGIMSMLMIGGQSVSKRIKESFRMTVIVDREMQEPEILKLQKFIDKKEYTQSSKYISKEQVLQEARESLGTDPMEFLPENPYEPEIEITLKNGFTDVEAMTKIKQELEKRTGVAEARFHKEHIDTVNDNINRIAMALLALFILLAIISWSLIGNLVRLAIYSKRFTLHTMKLVGATWGFIRRPFLLQNLYIGLVSGIIANAVLGIGIGMLQKESPDIASLFPAGQLAVAGIAVILFGILICTLCAFLSVNRFLRMRNNDLYFI